MMAKSVILLFLVMGFSIGAEALKCYNEHMEDASEETCRDDNYKCVQILSKIMDGMESEWRSLGCGPSCDLIKSDSPDIEDCKECETDLCNKKVVALELECYSSEQKKSVKCNPGEQCVTVKPTDGGAEERKCGKCEAGDKNCVACAMDQCNTPQTPPLMCQNTTNQPNVCPFPNKCFTITNGARVVDKGCGRCKRNDDEKSPKESEEICKECDKDDCNNEVATPHKCYNTSNVEKQCMDLRVTSCITNYIYGNPVEKGCGPCKYPVERKDGEKYSCTECASDKCNSKEIPQMSCHVGNYSGSSVMKCRPGRKCLVYRTGPDVDHVKWECGFCKEKGLENCNECDKNECNDIKGNWPTCKSGAGNGAGEFYQHNECLEDLSGPKDMKLSATCFKQQVEGITYKECGGCGAFVHDVPKYTNPPMFPETNNKPVSNKCFECKTEGGGDPCNGGIVNHVTSKAFWLLLLFGASVPWLVLPMMNAVIGF